jgi:hypothetical protein
MSDRPDSTVRLRPGDSVRARAFGDTPIGNASPVHCIVSIPLLLRFPAPIEGGFDPCPPTHGTHPKAVGYSRQILASAHSHAVVRLGYPLLTPLSRNRQGAA